MIGKEDPDLQTLDNGAILFKDRIYVPKNKTLHSDIISQFDDNLLGCPGR